MQTSVRYLQEILLRFLIKIIVSRNILNILCKMSWYFPKKSSRIAFTNFLRVFFQIFVQDFSRNYTRIFSKGTYRNKSRDSYRALFNDSLTDSSNLVQKFDKAIHKSIIREVISLWNCQETLEKFLTKGTTITISTKTSEKDLQPSLGSL